MARAILIIGEPGSGKSRAIKGLDPTKTVILKPNAKELPFRGAAKVYKDKVNMYTVKTLKGLGAYLDEINKAKAIKNIVIEDLTHFFSKRVLDERGTKGYDKWSDLAADIKTYIIDKESELRPDLNVFVIGHVMSSSDSMGNTVINLQTPGKLLDGTIKVPSYFTYIFHTFLDQDDEGNTRYRFLTNKDGTREAKSPEEMFPKYIDNDLQIIVNGITSYQNDEGIVQIGLSLEQKEKLDKEKALAKAAKAQPATEVPEVKKEDVADPSKNGKATAPEFQEAQA